MDKFQQSFENVGQNADPEKDDGRLAMEQNRTADMYNLLVIMRPTEQCGTLGTFELVARLFVYGLFVNDFSSLDYSSTDSSSTTFRQ
uniref:Uncharacterized protein n=1 Tax=Globodera rostochiensis TaxID=31243 RepID=A0A914HEN7_GLORO